MFMVNDFKLSFNKNANNRFDVNYIIDNGTGKDKKIKGINGFHGKFANFIGWILEKLFHKTVAVKVDQETFYLNCKSLVNWLNRAENQPDNPEKVSKVIDLLTRIGKEKDLDKNCHDSAWVTEILKGIAETNEQWAEQSAQKNKAKKIADALNTGNIEEAKKLGMDEKQLKRELNEKLWKEFHGNMDFAECRKLIEQGAEVNPTTASQTSLLRRVAETTRPDIQRDNLRFGELLLEKGADVNMKDYTGIFPLEAAVKCQNIPMIEWLINNGADVSLKPSKNESLEKMAKDNNLHENIIKMLKPGTPPKKVTITPAEREKINKQKEEENRKQDKLNRELENAMRILDQENVPENAEQIAMKLIAEGADGNIWRKKLNDNLYYAALDLNKTKCEKFIALGAQVNPTRGMTPLLGALYSKEFTTDFLDFLKEKNADVNLPDDDGKTPLEVAINRENEEAICWLLAQGADKSKKTSNGLSLFEHAKNKNVSARIINYFNN